MLITQEMEHVLQLLESGQLTGLEARKILESEPWQRATMANVLEAFDAFARDPTFSPAFDGKSVFTEDLHFRIRAARDKAAALQLFRQPVLGPVLGPEYPNYQKDRRYVLLCLQGGSISIRTAMDLLIRLDAGEAVELPEWHDANAFKCKNCGTVNR